VAVPAVLFAVKLIPLGSAPVSVIVGVDAPTALIVKELGAPVVKLVLVVAVFVNAAGAPT